MYSQGLQVISPSSIKVLFLITVEGWEQLVNTLFCLICLTQVACILISLGVTTGRSSDQAFLPS